MHQSQKNIDWLHCIRNEELKIALDLFPAEKNLKILEIGGGDGFIAKKIHEQGHKIISMDQIPKYPQHFPIIVGNASKLDWESETFDIIFSSHVLAHIDEIESFFVECKRVLKKNGLMIHIVPSTQWSIGTNFWHYILLPKYFIEWRRRSNILVQNKDNYKKKSNVTNRIINMLFLHPLGVNPSFIHEFYYFSKYHWKKIFQNYKFEIVNIKNGPYFYTGHNILKNKLLGFRRTLAKKGCVGSYCFVLKKINI